MSNPARTTELATETQELERRRFSALVLIAALLSVGVPGLWALWTIYLTY